MPETKAPAPTRKPPERRKLIAVIYADMVGYSRLIGLDDAGTLERLRALRGNLIEPAIEEHGGRIVQTGGDSFLVVFDSIDGAVRCAIKVQQELPIHDHDQPPNRSIRFRVGINIGDAIADGTDLHGDAVNVAARLQAECPPGGICVTRSVRDHVHGRLDLAFEELGTLNLKNIDRPVEAFLLKVDDKTAGSNANKGLDALSRPDKPSIAVLPFQNMSGDPEQEYFVDGMVEEIIAALSRIRWLFVMARNSSFTYKGSVIDVKQVAVDLGVRYVLEGSVRKSGNRVRIAGQLIDTATGAHLWVDRFDGSLEDVFDLQDKVASSVAGAIEPTLQAAEAARSRGRPPDNLTAYDLYLRGYAMVMSPARQLREALYLLEQAIDRDPRYGPALAWAALCCVQLIWDDRSEDSASYRLKGAEFARRALDVAGDDPIILATAALALAYFGEDIGAMMALVDRALALNPNYARGWHISGMLRNWAGQPDVAIEHVQASLRLSPRARIGMTFAALGGAYFLSRRFDEAVPKLLLAIQDDPNFLQTYRVLASCYAHMGRLDDAREVVTRLRAVTPAVRLEASFLRNAEQRELFLSGLHLALSETN
jgi:TolB-like protein/class 3 adenylate cyclase